MIRHADFKLLHVSRPRLLAALRLMGRDWLHDKKMDWSPENPTRNYCYVVTEFVHRYLMPDDSTVWKLEIADDNYSHRFNKLPDGKRVIDLAAEQFDFQPNYDAAIEFHFLKTGGPQPSKRAQMLKHVYDTGRLEGFNYRR